MKIVKSQAVIIGAIFLVLSLAILFTAMPVLATFIAEGQSAIPGDPFVQFLMSLFPMMLFIIIVIAFFIIARSE